jgi:hypothetical protein
LDALLGTRILGDLGLEIRFLSCIEIREAGLSARDLDDDLLPIERGEPGFVGVLISMEMREVGLENRFGESRMLKVEESRWREKQLGLLDSSSSKAFGRRFVSWSSWRSTREELDSSRFLERI